MGSPARGAPGAVVFDLDGTLVDSAPDIAVAINAAFEPLGVPTFSLPAVRTMIGGGATVAVRRAAIQAGVDLTPAVEAAALERFFAALGEASKAGRGLYPGAQDLLEHLASAGVPLAICTNKAEPITHVALEALGIARYFGAVVGATDALPKKPDPAMLHAALSGVGRTADGALMIGDTHADIDAAKAAGCRSIAVTFGYSRKPAAELGADAVIDHLSEVPAIIRRLWAATL